MKQLAILRLTSTAENHLIAGQGLKDLIVAAKYYDSLCRYYHGEFAVTNFEEEFFPPMNIEEARKHRDLNKVTYDGFIEKLSEVEKF